MSSKWFSCALMMGSRGGGSIGASHTTQAVEPTGTMALQLPHTLNWMKTHTLHVVIFWLLVNRLLQWSVVLLVLKLEGMEVICHTWDKTLHVNHLAFVHYSKYI